MSERRAVHVKTTRAALLSFLVAVFTFFPTELIPADAGATARASNNVTATSISSASFVVYATATPTGANPAGTALTLNNTSAAQYFYVRNTGTVSVARFSIAITYSGGPGTVTIDRCGANIAFSGTNTCASGTKTTMTISAGVMTLTIPANTWFAFELDPRKTVTPTISVSVSSTQIRPAVITNS
jgi:hypothetical protein